MNPVPMPEPSVENGLPKSYQLVLVRPANFVFVEAFREVMESVRAGFSELAIPCHAYTNRIASGAVPIVFGAHHLTPDDVACLPPETIIYNLEQMLEGYPWFIESYVDVLKKFLIWDFSTQNIALLKRLGIVNVRHVPIGYSPEITRIPQIEQDIDILFYGILSPHRQVHLRQFDAARLRVVVLNGVFGVERDAWIARAKLVLNLHNRPGGLFEGPRVCFLLANRKTVVSECDHPNEVDADLAPGLAAVPGRELVDTCRRLLADAGARADLSEKGYQLMTSPQRRASRILQNVLEAIP